MNDRHLHWIIWAWDNVIKETGNLENNVVIEVFADDLNSAMERAKKLVPNKSFYALRQVLEHFSKNRCKQ